MAKYTYIFYLKDNTIRVNEVGTNDTLQDVKVKGFYKYEYKSIEDFDGFFESLKDDCDIESFEDFNILILNWGIDEEVLESFKSHIADSPSVMVVNSERSRALTENVKDGELEEMEKAITEKESEIEKLNAKIEELESQHADKVQELEDTIADKDRKLADLEPKRSIVRAVMAGTISWKIDNFNKNNGDKPFPIVDSDASHGTRPESYGHFPTGFSENAWIAVVCKNTDGNYLWNDAHIVHAGRQGFLYRIADEMSFVKEGDPIAVMSTKKNDTGINQWLEKNGVKGKFAKYVKYDEYEEKTTKGEKILMGLQLVWE